MRLLSVCDTMFADAAGGADGGGAIEPHDAALTPQSRVMTVGPAAVGGGVGDVGAVGDCESEHAIANNNMKPHSVRFTAQSSMPTAMVGLPTEAPVRRWASRGDSAML